MEIHFVPEEDAVVIPVYQGGKEFVELLNRTLELVPANRVLVVDDGSTDGSAAESSQRQLQLIRFEENRGKGAALEAGLQWWYNNGAVRVVTIDADGQHPPELIGDLLRVSKRSNAGIVVAARDFRSKKMPIARRFSNQTTTKALSRLAQTDLFDSQSGFRCYHLRLLKQGLLPKSSRFAWESEVLVLAARAGEQIASIPLSVYYGAAGSSHIAHFRDSWRFIKLYFRLLRSR